MDSDWLSDDQQRVWRQWLRANALLTTELAAQLQPFGLGLPDYAVLVGLTDQEDGRRRMSELADLLQWDRSRLSHHLKRMQQRGLVTREECSEDRRGAYVRITDDGRRTIEQAAPAHVAVVRDGLFAGLSEAELAALDRATAGIVARLDT